ncbi:galactokinase [Angustibacter sp. McL0619]|uniref:galactokinase n=1 Tax=Angustibacter sp. McL0619 TaxID=3415676 RepID=UPI003CE6B6C1
MTGAPYWYPVPDVDARAAQVADSFEQVHSAPAAGVWAAPGRVNLIGEHTDYNGGLCLPIALPHSTFVAASSNSSNELVAHSVQRPDEPLRIALNDIGPGRPAGWGGYVAGAVAMLRAASDGPRVAGLTAVVDSDVPVGAGLSSSAALSCSMVLAAAELAGLNWADDDAGRARLVQVSVRGENEIAQVPSGGLDQAAALQCEPGHALLLDCADHSLAQVPFDVRVHGLALLVIDTRAEHTHSGNEYAARRAACEEAARELRVTFLREVADDPLEQTLAALDERELRPLVRHVVSEIARVQQVCELLDAGRLPEIGPLMDASHVSLRDDYRVSAPQLDVAVEVARTTGALGARMTGGGFGGSAIALLPLDAVDAVSEAVHEAFARRHWTSPAFLLAEPSPSGRRIR